MQAGKQGVLSSEVVFIYYTSGIGNWTRLSFYTAPGKVCLSTTNQTGYYAGRQAEVQGKLDIVFVFRQVEVQGK